MIWIAFAAQLAAPDPKAMWIKVGDNPMPTKEVTVSYRSTVDPNGNIRDCVIERTNGTPKIDALTCKITLDRAKFHAARWTDGTAVYGLYRTSVSWLPFGAESTQHLSAGDLVLTVRSLPDGMTSPASIRLVLAVDELGRISECEGVDSSQNPTLVTVACAQVSGNYRPIAIKNPEGASVRSVQPLAVVFVKE
jgi:hypothetical protein